MTYKRVTQTERRLIRMWRQGGYRLRGIAKHLGRSPSTIIREIERNSGRNGYLPNQAHRMALERAKRPGERRFTQALKESVEASLKDGWTPEIISGRARVEGRPSVCKETIYKHIYADSEVGGTLWKYLPRAHRKRRRRCPRDEGLRRTYIPNQRMIDTRPPEVETRTVIGHWEGDLICGIGKTGNLVTLVERSTRFALVGRTATKETREVIRRISKMFSEMPHVSRLSLTLDNGREFSLHERLAEKTGMDIFFANPYHSWERGTNENTNGLIRRLHPKKSSFAHIDKTDLKRIDVFLNDRPRKCLGWKTPREVMTVFLASAS